MPESPIHDIGQETSQRNVGPHDQEVVQFVDPPLVVHPGEDRAQDSSQWIRFALLHRHPAVNDPGEGDRKGGQHCGQSGNHEIELGRMDMPQRVLQPMRQGVQTGEVQGTADDRKRSQPNQRQGHHRGILGRVIRGLRTGLPEEDHQDLASHVESREERGCSQEPVNQRVDMAGVSQDLILGPEACQGWYPRQGQRADEIHPERDLHARPQATHVAHVLWIEGWPLGLLAMLHMMMPMLDALDHGSRR